LRETESILPFHQEPSDCLQGFSARAKAIERLASRSQQRVRPFAGFVESKKRGISRFLRSDILARSLSQLFRRLGPVEDVVDDMKRQSNRLAVSA